MSNFIRAMVLAAVLGGALAACRDARGDTLDEDTFVQVIFDLQIAAREASTDTARFELMRDSILDHHGVTADDLRQFAESTYRDPAKLSEVWDSIGILLSEQELQ